MNSFFYFPQNFLPWPVETPWYWPWSCVSYQLYLTPSHTCLPRRFSLTLSLPSIHFCLSLTPSFNFHPLYSSWPWMPCPVMYLILTIIPWPWYWTFLIYWNSRFLPKPLIYNFSIMNFISYFTIPYLDIDLNSRSLDFFLAHPGPWYLPFPILPCWSINFKW